MSEIGQKLEAEIRRLVAESPDFIYQAPNPFDNQCKYIHQGKGSCIVGQALMNTGLVGTDLERDTTRIKDGSFDYPGYLPNTVTAPTLLKHLGFELDQSELQWLCEIQSQQDNNVAWGEALQHADDPDTYV